MLWQVCFGKHDHAYFNMHTLIRHISTNTLWQVHSFLFRKYKFGSKHYRPSFPTTTPKTIGTILSIFLTLGYNMGDKQPQEMNFEWFAEVVGLPSDGFNLRNMDPKIVVQWRSVRKVVKCGNIMEGLILGENNRFVKMKYQVLNCNNPQKEACCECMPSSVKLK